MFTAEEECAGRAALEEIGIPHGAPFVCFAARDSAYLDARYPGRDWSYHDYRDCAIHNFKAAAEELVNRAII